MGSRSITFLNPYIVVSDRPWTTLLTCAHLQNLKVDTTTVTSAISMQSAGPSLTPADFLWSHSFSLFISFFVFVLTCCFKPHVHYSHSSLEITLTLRTLTLSSCHTQWCIAKNGGGYTQRGVAKGLEVPCLFMITEVSICCQKNPEVGIWRIPAYTPQYTTGHTII